MSYHLGDLLFFKPSFFWAVPLLLGQGTLNAGERPFGFGHVAVAMGDGAGNATGTAIQALGQGIVQTGFYTPDAVVPYPGAVEPFIAALKEQLGKPYDYVGLLCVPAWRFFRWCPDGNCAHTHARFCSSLVVDAIRHGDSSLTNVCGDVPSRAVSPDRLYSWAISTNGGKQ